MSEYNTGSFDFNDNREIAAKNWRITVSARCGAFPVDVLSAFSDQLSAIDAKIKNWNLKH